MKAARRTTDVLVGDIGGTKTLLAFGRRRGGGVRWLRRTLYRSGDFPDFASLLRDFLGPGERPVRACLAVAGPVERQGSGERARVTNLPWALDTVELSALLGAPSRLINDFEGVAWGIPHLPRSAFATLQRGIARPGGVRAVLGAGTGLGMAVLVPRGSGWQVLPSEGGHADFAPLGPLQEDFARWLRTHGRLDHLSIERVLSGPGLEALYAYLTRADAARRRQSVRAPDMRAAAAHGDAEAALTLDTFARIYGAQAGNLALLTLARGGVYLAGGIAPVHADLLASGPFLEAFCAKGRFRALLRRMPVRIVLDTEVGLRGAAAVAFAEEDQAAA